MYRNGKFMDFDEDPFFSDPFRAHRDQMRQMMRSFSEPLGGSFMPSITDGRSHNAAEPPALSSEHRCTRKKGRQARGEHSNTTNSTQEGRSQAIRSPNVINDFSRSLLPFDSTDTIGNPFGMFDNIMTSMKNRMEGMYKSFENMTTDGNGHSFSSSSVMTYSKVGNEAPKVFQASSSTRRAPGGVKETVKALKDSESGLEKMAIGHHIQDRGHVVEKKMNRKTGDKEVVQDFQNMDESEVQSFDDEWQKKCSNFKPSVPMAQMEPPRRQRGLNGPEETQREKPRSNPKGILKSPNPPKK